jgi:hypothetical protein
VPLYSGPLAQQATAYCARDTASGLHLEHPLSGLSEGHVLRASGAGNARRRYRSIAKAGVENIEYFDAILQNTLTGQQLLTYKAFNIIGAVSAADMDASELMGTSSSRMGDADFHALVLDESRIDDLLMFRLAEALNAIVVHESVCKAIEAAGIPGFVFYGPAGWSG